MTNLAPSSILHPSALEPLFLPWEEPRAHRVRAEREGEPARIVKGRRPSQIAIAQNLRQAVSEWRQAEYSFGCSETTRELLHHWFLRSHRVRTKDGDAVEFHYYFCQREAIETLIYLMEVRGLTSLSAITAEFGGPEAELAALGINPEEDRWPRYAFKVATGAGKTKIMSLAVVWSYFHALRESDSPLARHFVIIAPNLTVFERLKEDFGDGRIFDADPLIPPAWRGDWNLSVVLQDEAAGAATGGVLYLTNIHRLYEPKKRGRAEAETYDWVGPPVSRAKALDTGDALRRRVTSHPRLMALNDEAHHVWDPESAWNEALGFLDQSLREQFGTGLAAQLDFSATPKDNKGNLFQQIICDAPLGEAVDGGIVKTPIIGRGQRLVERADDDAAYKYEEHLHVGYQRWLRSKEEWEQSGKKALMFVMCNDTNAADQITRRLNKDSLFAELNGQTVNLHTNLKGKLKKRGRGQNVWYEFVEDEKVVDVDQVPRTTVSIFPDAEHKDLKALDILIPRLTAAHRIVPQLGDVTFDEIRQGFARLRPLPLGEAQSGEIEYEGRHLFTDEIVEQMKFKLPLLESGMGAVSYYREELERICGIRGTHPKLAPLIQQFLEEVLFVERTTLFDPRLVARLADSDVREHLRAVFVPLIRKKITLTEERTSAAEPQSVTAWRPFQVTHSERHPTVPAERTPFNLVPCNHELEVALTEFVNRAPEGVFQRLTGNKIDDLTRACAPALADLIHEADTAQIPLPFDQVTAVQRAAELDEFIASDNLATLPGRRMPSPRCWRIGFRRRALPRPGCWRAAT